jgi:callose synthase
MIQEDSAGPGTTYFHLYLIVLGSYAGAQLLVTALFRIPLFRRQADKCSNWSIIRFIFWLHEDRYFVGRGMYERTRDYLGYITFWVVVLACKFAFSYHFQVKSLASPTKTIVNLGPNELQYKWHDLVSRSHHNALTIASLWAPVIMIYYLDTQVWYTVTSALVGGLSGARARLGEIRTLSMLRKRFSTFPQEMSRILVPSRIQTQQLNRSQSQSTVSGQAGWSKGKVDAFKFAPLWNEIITSLREEDYISNREKELLVMPSNMDTSTNMVQWPLFLLANKVSTVIYVSG